MEMNRTMKMSKKLIKFNNFTTNTKKAHLNDDKNSSQEVIKSYPFIGFTEL